jgi:hypothetical protein
MRPMTQQQITDDMWRRLFYDIEALIQILSKQADPQVVANNTTYENALKGLNSAQVLMAPSVTNTVIVPASPNPPILLIENTVLNLMQVTFCNDDFAIPVYIGDRDVVIPAGDLLDPRQRLTYHLRKGQKKYAIALAGTVNVIVNRGESAYGAVTADAQGGIIVM